MIGKRRALKIIPAQNDFPHVFSVRMGVFANTATKKRGKETSSGDEVFLLSIRIDADVDERRLELNKPIGL